MSDRSPILRRGRQTGPREGEAPARRVLGSPVVPRRRVPTPAMVLAKAEREAGAIIEAAQTAAEEAARAARAGTAAIEAGARGGGYEDGLRQGRATAQAELAEAMRLVQIAATEAKALRDRIWRDAQPQLLRLVAEAARRVIGEIAAAHPEVVLRAVQEALHRAGDQRILRVRVHPDQREIVEARYGPEERDWALRSDAAIALGGCVVDTAAGVVDASIEAQVSELEAAWQQAR